jgi:uncharacterized protein HemX
MLFGIVFAMVVWAVLSLRASSIRHHAALRRAQEGLEEAYEENQELQEQLQELQREFDKRLAEMDASIVKGRTKKIKRVDYCT